MYARATHTASARASLIHQRCVCVYVRRLQEQPEQKWQRHTVHGSQSLRRRPQGCRYLKFVHEWIVNGLLANHSHEVMKSI